ncbi:NAD(P)H-binding protein [Mycolicibacterium fortuitum]|nr:NAD(P)H-binding protein [Mycolicibacterium fortuitum]OBG54156.1 NAD-dependent epimerase [Mycolicibacterium fortuitum]
MTDTASKRILVIGASGYVGSRLVSVLLTGGHRVVVAGRSLDKLADYGWFHDVTAVQLDADDPLSTNAAFEQIGPVDLVYYLAHGIGQSGFREADSRAAANVAAASQVAGVERIVYLGGFVPESESLSDHLAGRAEVAQALRVDGGPEVVWLGAALIIGSGSTSFEILRYVADRFPVLPAPAWMGNRIDPISIRDVLHYLVAAGESDQVPAGDYDICGPDVTTYRGLVATYARLAGTRRLTVPIGGPAAGVAARVSAAALPIPAGLATDLITSLDHPMSAAREGIRTVVPDPPGGLLTVDEAIRRALGPDGSQAERRPVTALADPHHLADTDPVWAGGDAARIRELTPGLVRSALGLLPPMPGPVAAVVRSGLDAAARLVPSGA